MEMSVGALDHYNVSTRKLKETVQFYEEILGFCGVMRCRGRRTRDGRFRSLFLVASEQRRFHPG